MNLSTLLDELVLEVVSHLEYEIDINALARTNRRFYRVLNDYTYKRLLRNLPAPALEWAAEHGKDACIGRLLDVGVLNHTDGFDAIHHAVRNGHVSVVKLFLQHGIKPFRLKNQQKEPVEQDADDWEDAEDMEDAIHLKDADDSEDADDETGPNFLFTAIEHGHDNLVRMFIEHGAEIKYSWLPEEQTPLAVATRHFHTPIIQTLIQNGCDPRNCMLGLLWPTRGLKIKPIKTGLLQSLIDMGIDPNFYEEEFRMSLLRTAIHLHDPALLRFLLEKGISPKRLGTRNILRALIMIPTRHPDMITLLLSYIDMDAFMEHGPDSARQHLVDALSASGLVAPLEDLLQNANRDAIARPNLSIYEGCLQHAIVLDRFDVVNLLLDHSVSPNGQIARPWRGRHPLMAGYIRNNEMAKLLLGRGADLPNQGSDLFHGVFAHRNLEMIQWLLDRGLMPSTGPNLESSKALGCAAKGNETVFKLLLQFGFKLLPEDPRHQETFRRSAQYANIGILEAFLDAGFDINVSDTEWTSRNPIGGNLSPAYIALVFAASGKDFIAAEKAVDFLLARGARFSVRTFFGDEQSPLFSLALKPPFIFSSENGDDVVHFTRSIVFHGDDENSAGKFLDYRDYAPSFLDDEAKCRAVKLLVQKGADPCVTTPAAESPLGTAVKHNFLMMAQTLLESIEAAQMPFDQVNEHLRQALNKGLGVAKFDKGCKLDRDHSTTTRFLYRYYWRRMYPSP